MKNTKSNTAANITVLDQIPVSEDDKLQIHVLEPRGLGREGDEVSISAFEGDEGKGRGRGVVTLGKNGEVKWEIRLEGGKEVSLVLQYELRAPSGWEVSTV